MTSPKELLQGIYKENLLQTLYNTPNHEHMHQGWRFRSARWSPWYLNLRPLGSHPDLAKDIGKAMYDMIFKAMRQDGMPLVDHLVGIEMAGVPLAAIVAMSGKDPFAYGYTRPIGAKPKTEEEARQLLQNMAATGYGMKEILEGDYKDGTRICLIDDVATDFASKVVAREICRHSLSHRGIANATIDDVAIVLDRGGGKEAGKYRMRCHSLITMEEGLPWLEEVMQPNEWALIMDYQRNPEWYQHKNRQEEAIDLALRTRGAL